MIIRWNDEGKLHNWVGREELCNRVNYREMTWARFTLTGSKNEHTERISVVYSFSALDSRSSSLSSNSSCLHFSRSGCSSFIFQYRPCCSDAQVSSLNSSFLPRKEKIFFHLSHAQFQVDSSWETACLFHPIINSIETITHLHTSMTNTSSPCQE